MLSCLLALSFSFQSSSLRVWELCPDLEGKKIVEATEERLLNWEGVYAALWTFPNFLSFQKMLQCWLKRYLDEEAVLDVMTAFLQKGFLC